MIFRVVLIALIIFTSNLTAKTFYIDSVPECKGNDLITDKKYIEAIKSINSYKYKDIGYLLLKQGEISYSMGNYSSARKFLSEVTTKSKMYAPYAYRRLGDIANDEGNAVLSITSYKKAAELTTRKPYKDFLYSIIDSTVNKNDSIKELPWLEAWKDNGNRKQKSNGKKWKNYKKIWQNRINAKPLTEKRYKQLLALANKSKEKRYFFRELGKSAKSVKAPFSAKRLFAISKYLYSAGLPSNSSDWLHLAIKKENFSKEVSSKKYFELRGELNYSLKNWSNAIIWYKKYFEKYGHTPIMVYHMARAYRSMGEATKSGYWYNQHISLFPKHKKTYDILWYQAWKSEENHKFTKAIYLFSLISKNHPNKKHGDDAYFRVGLLNFRTGKYKKAITEFQNFREKYPRSKLFSGSYYWEARSQLGLKNKKEADKLFNTCVSEYPLNYYAWRSREMMDNIPYPLISGLKSIEDKKWRDSLLVKSTFITDTLWEVNYKKEFELAVKLGSIGFYDEAIIIIEPVEIRGEGNLALIFTLSKLYKSWGRYHKSYRMARKIYWSNPVHDTLLPVDYIKSIYPEVFPKTVVSSGKRFSVPTGLIRGIMKQESMFSIPITSPVGASGLMQIMSYTGQEIADDLDTAKFDKSMLFDADINIHFGTYYISKLLGQFDGVKEMAIAGYNGGPHNVKKWIARNKDILDDKAMFVECVGFSETRNYVKRVLQNFWVYEALYGIDK